MEESIREVTRLWVTAQPAVSAFIASVVRDFRDRDDILQDVAVAVLESSATYDPKRPFRPWVIGIARHLVHGYLRRRRLDRLVFDPETVEMLATSFSETGIREERRLEHVAECVQELGERPRKICELRYLHDLKPAAISGIVGMSANAVAKYLQRVREQLRNCLGRKALCEEGLP